MAHMKPKIWSVKQSDHFISCIHEDGLMDRRNVYFHFANIPKYVFNG